MQLLINKTNSMLQSLRIFLSIALMLSSALTLIAQEEKLIKHKNLLKDIDQLVSMIEAHPDPYTKTSEETFNAKIKEVKASIDEPMSELEFFKKAASIIALIKDGHSSVRLPEFWLRNKRKELGAFPFEFHLSNEDKLYIIKDFSGNLIEPGSEVTTINGVSVIEFLNTIDPYISYELKSFRNTIIDIDLEPYLYMAFGHSDKTALEYKTPDGEEKGQTIDNMDYKEWKNFQKDDKEEREKMIAMGKPYKFSMLGDGVAKIDIYAFSAADFSAYEVFLDHSFKEIKKENVHSLIIDVRGNFGGWPKISSNLFHYLTETYFKTMALSSTKISQTYKDKLFEQYPGLQTYQNHVHFKEARYYRNFNDIVKGKVGSFAIEESFFNEPPRTENFEFTGDCYVLIDRDSYSAASSFASTFQCYQMGEIIGEETGGTKVFRANSIYNFLSKSKVGVGIATTLMFTPCYNEELEGVRPNHQFTPSIEDIINDVDSQLIFTQELIKKVKAGKK